LVGTGQLQCDHNDKVLSAVRKFIHLLIRHLCATSNRVIRAAAERCFESGRRLSVVWRYVAETLLRGISADLVCVRRRVPRWPVILYPSNAYEVLAQIHNRLPERNPLRNNTLITRPVTPIDMDRQVGVIGPLALLRLCRWIEQRSQVTGGAKPCNSISFSNHFPQHPPVINGPGESDRALGSAASSPAEGPGSNPRRDRAAQSGQQPPEGEQ